MRTRDHAYFDAVHDKLRGERCFILGTGPSLGQVEGINRLKGEYTFGVNYLYHCMKVSGSEGAFLEFVPQWWACGEIDFLMNIDAQIAGLPTQRILSCQWDPSCLLTPGAEDIWGEWLWVYRPDKKLMQDGWFSGFEPEFWWAADGGSVVFDGPVQLAAWMGFERVYLLGCETTISGHAYPDKYEPPARDRERQGMVQRSAKVAGSYFERSGRKLIDLSGPTGTLSLPKARLKDVL